MSNQGDVKNILDLIEQLPAGRMRDKYKNEYEKMVSRTESKQQEKEQIKISDEIGKRINTQCFMCRRVIEKVKTGKELTEADVYHISVCVPAIASLREINDTVQVDIGLVLKNMDFRK